jgi:hypothetical protein
MLDFRQTTPMTGGRTVALPRVYLRDRGDNLAPIKYTSRLVSALAAAALLTLYPPADSASATGPADPYVQGEPLVGLIRLTVTPDNLPLDSIMILPDDEGVPRLPACQGTLYFSVSCALPQWSVVATAIGLSGPEGVVQNQRVSVACEQTGGAFVPLVGPVLIGEGTGGVPSGERPLIIRAEPHWEDATGAYEGLIRLTAIAGDVSEEHEIEPMEGGGAEVGQSISQVRDVRIEFTVEGLTIVMTSVTECTLDAGPGPGTYYVEPDIGFLVATNEHEWEVRLEGTPFESGESEIPLERVLWSLLDPSGEPDEWTLIGDGNVVLWGFQETGVFVEALRLALETTMADQAGTYSCSIRLTGAPR